MKWLLLCLFAALMLVGCKTKQRAVKIDVEQKDTLKVEAVNVQTYIDTTRTTTAKTDAQTVIVETIERTTTYDTAHADNRIIEVKEKVNRQTYKREQSEAADTIKGVSIVNTDSVRVEQTTSHVDKSTCEEEKTPAVVSLFDTLKPLLIIALLLFFVGWMIILVVKDKKE